MSIETGISRGTIKAAYALLLELDNLNEIKMFTNQDPVEEIKRALDESEYLLLPPEYDICEHREVIQLLQRLQVFQKED